MITIPAGAKQVAFKAVVLDVNGKPKKGVPPIEMAWHINPIINAWLQVSIAVRYLWRKLWLQF